MTISKANEKSGNITTLPDKNPNAALKPNDFKSYDLKSNNSVGVPSLGDSGDSSGNITTLPDKNPNATFKSDDLKPNDSVIAKRNDSLKLDGYDDSSDGDSKKGGAISSIGDALSSLVVAFGAQLGLREDAAEELFLKVREFVNSIDGSEFDSFISFNSSSIEKEPDIKAKLDSVISHAKILIENVVSFEKTLVSSYNSAMEKIKDVDNYMDKETQIADLSVGAAAGAAGSAAGAAASSTSGGSTSGGSTSGGSTSGGSTSGSSKSGSSKSGSSKSGDSKSKSSTTTFSSDSDSKTTKTVGLVSAVEISAEVLASYGVTKGNIANITKSENGYTISIVNQNVDGKWKATDIKEYYIKDGSVSGALTGNDTYIKIENGKIQIDESSSKIYNDVFSPSAGVPGTSSAGSTTTAESSINYATQTSYNTDANKAIFNKFYPNATEGEFDNFCSQISESQTSYSAAAKSLINTYKGDIADISAKNGYNYLVIENNTIKVDYKSVATELYAYESSKTGISYADGMGTQLSFNESTATDLSEYVKQNYSVDVDFKSLVGNTNEAVSSSANSAIPSETPTMEV